VANFQENDDLLITLGLGFAAKRFGFDSYGGIFAAAAVGHFVAKTSPARALANGLGASHSVCGGEPHPLLSWELW